jgi:hypothetical protein
VNDIARILNPDRRAPKEARSKKCSILLQKHVFLLHLHTFN